MDVKTKAEVGRKSINLKWICSVKASLNGNNFENMIKCRYNLQLNDVNHTFYETGVIKKMTNGNLTVAVFVFVGLLWQCHAVTIIQLL